jgi:hypothetical protein
MEKALIKIKKEIQASKFIDGKTAVGCRSYSYFDIPKIRYLIGKLNEIKEFPIFKDNVEDLFFTNFNNYEGNNNHVQINLKKIPYDYEHSEDYKGCIKIYWGTYDYSDNVYHKTLYHWGFNMFYAKYFKEKNWNKFKKQIRRVTNKFLEERSAIDDSKLRSMHDTSERFPIDREAFEKRMIEIIRFQKEWYMKNKDKVINLDGNDDFAIID